MASNCHEGQLRVLLNQMAAMVNVELSADLTAQFEVQNVSEEAAQLLALELFREQKVSSAGGVYEIFGGATASLR